MTSHSRRERSPALPTADCTKGALRHRRRPRPETVAAKRMRQLVASPNLIKTQTRLTSPDKLSKRPAVLFSGGVQMEEWPFLVNGKRTQVSVRGQLCCNNAQVGIDACVAGLGYGYFLSYQIEDLVKKRKLTPLLKKHLLPPIPVHIVFPESRLLSARTRVLIDWLKQRLRVEVSRLANKGQPATLPT